MYQKNAVTTGGIFLEQNQSTNLMNDNSMNSGHSGHGGMNSNIVTTSTSNRVGTSGSVKR